MVGEDVTFRDATAEDAPAIAALHADSWRRHYRGAYPEDFFGPSLDDDRRSVWQERLRPEALGTSTTVAELGGGALAGFVHVVLQADARFGALVDNLHVRHELHRRGIASALMARAASVVEDRQPGSGVYLWVLELNTRAQAFYAALGGEEAEREQVDPPAFDGVLGIRIVWPEARSLAHAASPPAG